MSGDPINAIYEDTRVTIEMVGPLGPLGNNSYIVRPLGGGGGPAIVVDAPEGSEAVVAALGGDAVSAIVITHQHRDHWAGLATLRASVDAPVYMGDEPQRLEIDVHSEVLRDGESLAVGRAELEVISTPGHTPGSICLYIKSSMGGAVLTGDTLFPGGPGRTGSHEALMQELDSIVSRLHVLPGHAVVLPGHGDGTSIRASQVEYAVFANKEHPDDLAGDVTWYSS
ncbi:MAG: MBL fold metallo-hydrolase [Chloroflexi bacterium]|nr:MAG: MBL fold metallo-hydrolase [Chloroflexota bacterium]